MWPAFMSKGTGGDIEPEVGKRRRAPDYPKDVAFTPFLHPGCGSEPPRPTLRDARIAVKITECRVIVFAKAPIPGKVKTRLIPAIGSRAAAALHERLVYHSLSTAVDAGVGAVDLWCAPSPEHPFFIECVKKFPVDVHTQSEGDLGQRMAHAFDKTMKISTHALLMGTDSPSLTCSDLRKAKAVLEQDYNAVIIPVEDGGYVLLGLCDYSPELFSGVSWGTQLVLEQTRVRLRHLGWRWYELPKRWDVDRPEDLRRLMVDKVGEKFLDIFYKEI